MAGVRSSSREPAGPRALHPPLRRPRRHPARRLRRRPSPARFRPYRSRQRHHSSQPDQTRRGDDHRGTGTSSRIRCRTSAGRTPSSSDSGRSSSRCSRTGSAMARTSSGLTKSRSASAAQARRGAHDGLRGARTGAHQNAVVGACAAHHFHGVFDQLRAHVNLGQRLAQAIQVSLAERLRNLAAPQHGLRRGFGQAALGQRSSSSPAGHPIGIFSMKRSFCASGRG